MKSYNIPDNSRKIYYIDPNDTERNLVFDVKHAAQLTVLLVGRVTNEVDFHINILLSGRDAAATIVGCTFLVQSGSLKLTSLQHHIAPNTTSDLLVKNVLTDSSAFTYQGVIKVERSAQGADAYQRNENLLVSPNVYCDSKPILEILANDVRCTHGATSGPLSDEEIWYITSRGISKATAKNLITSGFLKSVTAKLSDKKTTKLLEDRIWELI